MLFQAVDAFRYKIVGGQGIVETSRANRHAIGPLGPYDLPAVFLRASTGELSSPPTSTLFGLPPLPKRDLATIEQFQAFTAENGISAIVVTDATSPGARLAISYLTAAFGAPSLVAAGSLAVWPDAALTSAGSAQRPAGANG
jgi:hypothetical protein